MPLVCCQLVRRGRYVAAEPYAGGGLVSLANGKEFVDDAGKLALVATAVNVGRVVEVLGAEDDIRAALRGLLADAGRLGPVPAPGRIVDEPTVEMQRELDELPTDIPFVDTREDLRYQPCITIDPPGAKDFDDAIHVERTSDGFTAWVHIADVSAYVLTGSALDTDARQRAMSTYVPGIVAPMLPHQLSSDLCSLRPGVDRGTVSVELQLDHDGNVTAQRFARTLIRSSRRLTYHDADAVLSGERSIDPLVDEQLAVLDDLTAKRKQLRSARGALAMELPELAISLDHDRVGDAVLEQPSPSHRLVEECMLLANEAVGGFLAENDAPGIWRVHDDPDPAAVEALVKMFEHLGVPTPALPEVFTGRPAARYTSEIAASVRKYVVAKKRGEVAFLPRVLRALQRARYDANAGWHSGLAASNYAHFTSPIRRYPDLVNHRSLLRLLGLGDEEPAAINLDAIAEHVSFVESESVGVERRANAVALSHRMYEAMYHRDHSPQEVGADSVDRFTGEVVGLIASGCFIRFGSVFEGFVQARTISAAERYDLDETGLALVGGKSGHAVTLGDVVKVRIDNIDRSAGKISLRLA